MLPGRRATGELTGTPTVGTSDEPQLRDSSNPYRFRRLPPLLALALQTGTRPGWPPKLLSQRGQSSRGACGTSSPASTPAFQKSHLGVFHPALERRHHTGDPAAVGSSGSTGHRVCVPANGIVDPVVAVLPKKPECHNHSSSTGDVWSDHVLGSAGSDVVVPWAAGADVPFRSSASHDDVDSDRAGTHLPGAFQIAGTASGKSSVTAATFHSARSTPVHIDGHAAVNTTRSWSICQPDALTRRHSIAALRSAPAQQSERGHHEHDRTDLHHQRL